MTALSDSWQTLSETPRDHIRVVPILFSSFGAQVCIQRSIALGIAVDNTIHFMTRLSAEVRKTSDQEQALLATLSTIGKPVFLACFTAAD